MSRRNRKGVRHTYEDALGEREFQLLLEGATLLDEKMRLEARFCVLLGGRLGLRAGEICHLSEDWVNWDRSMINIPMFRDCDCGYCHNQARQEAGNHEELTAEESMRTRWRPKTEMASRAIPFDFSPRLQIVMERFFKRYDEFPYSRVTVNRRVNRAAKKAERIDEETTYPHCLRATAATYHSARGLKALQLQAFLGWEDVETAQKYVQLTGEHTARALRNVHNR